MKAVLMSIRPKWCELIASGEKTVEVRKTKPKLEPPFKCYIYCTIGDGAKGDRLVPSGIACGKVIGEFMCKEIEGGYLGDAAIYRSSGTCLSPSQLADYADDGLVYFWHISNLVIYDEPRELGEFWGADKCPYASVDGCTYKFHCFRAGQTKRCGNTLTRPPQSWCYVEEQNGSRRSLEQEGKR